MYKVQYYDTDTESWEDAEDTEEFQPTSSKSDAEDDAREMKRRCAYPIRTRVVKEGA